MKRNRITGIVLAVANGILLFICAVLYLGKDRQGPEITFEAIETVYREGIVIEELLKGVSARDKKDGEISDRIVIEKISENREESTAVVFYAVSDKAGNVTRASRVFEAVFADQDEGNVEGRFLDAGIEAELKEGNIINSGIEDKETESGTGDREEDNEESSFEDTAREDIYNNTEEREQGSDAAHTPAPSPTPTGQPSPSPTPAIREEGEQAGTEPERESEDSREPEAGAEPENMPETMPEPEAASDQERGNTANAQAPVLSLKVSEIEVKAGQGPAWVDIIGTLSDDKDGYETLFRNLNVSRYDRNKPGTYQVSVSTQDTDGNQSEAVPFTIIVK